MVAPRPPDTLEQTGERPQPLTPDTIPDPPATPRPDDDTSALTPQEAAEYAQCERAIDHYHQSTWMYAKALQVVRDSRYYREEYRTWAEYLEHRCGISESQAHRLIEEWPLAAAIQHELGRPPVQSHVTKLMPVVKAYSVDAGVRLYALLQDKAASQGVRLTAQHVHGVARAVLARAGRAAELEQVESVAAEITSEPLGLESGQQQKPRETQRGDNGGGAIRALSDALAAQRTVWAALSRKTVDQAVEEDPERAGRLLAEIEMQARRTSKRAQYRP